MSIRFFLLLALFLALGQLLRAQPGPDLEAAIQPLTDGVPEVAIERLQTFLARNPTPAEQTVARRHLVEALVRAGQPEQALDLFAGASGLTNDAEAIFWRAQALATLGRWSEALPFYQKASAEMTPPRSAEATFGEAEALRALGHTEDAIRVLRTLEDVPRWSTRAKLGVAQLLIARGNLSAAERLLRATKAQLTSERNERRFLFGRLNLAQGHPERAIETLGVILKKPEGVSHPLLVATLFSLADAHIQTRTPESGDDALEEFIDHHPNDSALPAIFTRLDALYQMERKPSTNELEHWMRDPAQPRQALAQWYFARSRLRAGDREKAIELLTQLRESRGRFPSLGEADLELARLHLEKEEWAPALAAAQAAREQNPAPAFVERVDWLIAEIDYRSGQLEKAAPIYERLAQRSTGASDDALFNAALCWLRLDRTAEYAADYRKITNDPANQDGAGRVAPRRGSGAGRPGEKGSGPDL
jgi:tetratricopeptide (TPR) repeat protein